jgi:hypothetical protein
MSTVTCEGSDFSVDAAIVAEGLGIEPATVLDAMRQGRITSLCERGVDEDAGRSRLTFFHGDRRLRLVIDEGGTILDRSVEDGVGRRGRADRGPSPFARK